MKSVTTPGVEQGALGVKKRKQQKATRMAKAFFRMGSLFKGTLIGVSSYYLISKPLVSSEEKSEAPPSPTLSHPHFTSSSQFAPELPHYSQEYNKAIIASLPHLVALQLWGAPGISVSVMVKGELVWSQAFGYADVENAVPLSTQSRMRVASISKAFTSAALGVLYENGQIDLDKPIQFYLPQFPEHSQPITARLLASHLSGINHYLNLNEFYSSANYKSIHDAVEAIKGRELGCPTGTKYLYSTYGFTVLSAVMEKAAGKDYLALMQEKVFGPLGMLHTCPDEPDTIIPHRARLYRYKTPLQNSPYVDVSNKWAGGGFLSTSEDVARFGSAMIRGELLKKETIKLLFTPQKTVSGTEVPYGLGWELKKLLPEGNLTRPSEYVVFHTGGAVEVVVAIIMNVQEVKGIYPCALRIAKTFEASSYETKVHAINR